MNIKGKEEENRKTQTGKGWMAGYQHRSVSLLISVSSLCFYFLLQFLASTCLLHHWPDFLLLRMLSTCSTYSRTRACVSEVGLDGWDVGASWRA